MDLGQLIKHPEMMDKETLYDLRSLVALYPYYQTARLLMLQNLYVLHSQSFDEELRKASVYFTDRRVVFKLVEAAHYKLRNAGLWLIRFRETTINHHQFASCFHRIFAFKERII